VNLHEQRLNKTYVFLPLVEVPCDSCAVLACKQGCSFLGDSTPTTQLVPLKFCQL